MYSRFFVVSQPDWLTYEATVDDGHDDGTKGYRSGIARATSAYVEIDCDRIGRVIMSWIV